ncbi:hypothetical protein KXV68_009282 [Aspergillus fumigatus]|nr:hypothetical protein CNMCM8812_002568 [Aspergillus fumigatus]KMK58191.1 hypothetical protein Y699_03611 [Aspergillus fumigatus Z5]KAF4267305.1 hypothetical protein CNMCM8714_003687 [Aspergillus fumigatus]KAF4271720.1 hypothetical protein CNMCM8057_006893 [Aspergillus fumigatus]KAH1299562.1 hypothetical protein KXX11_006399 [Aspergillus fumigatus]
MTDQSKKRCAVVSRPAGSDRKRTRRTKPETSDSDEPIVLSQIPSHPPPPALPRSTRSAAPGPVPAPAPGPALRRAAPTVPPLSTRSVIATDSPCLPCVKKWTDDGSTVCHRDAALGKCRSCSQAGVECSGLPNHFYGPLSAAQKLPGRARRRACTGIKIALEAYERKNEENAPTRENPGSGSSGHERSELLMAIRSLNKHVFRLTNTIREVRGMELIADEEI